MPLGCPSEFMQATPPSRPPRGAPRSPGVSPSPSRPLQSVAAAARSPTGEAYGGGTPLSPSRGTLPVTLHGAPSVNAELRAVVNLRTSRGDEPPCHVQWCARGSRCARTRRGAAR